MSFDKYLSPTLYISLISSAKALTAITKRLSLHLPNYLLKSVVSTLVHGKIGYACLVLPPRFKASDPTNVLISQLQVNVNNAARAILGSSKSDQVKEEDFLNKTGLPSINRKIVYTIAMECWRALNLCDVPNGPLNPLGCILSPPSSTYSSSQRTRAATSGCIPPPAKHLVESFSWWAYTCCNSSSPLRSANTVFSAKRAANELAASCPPLICEL